jgi:hypothetical protein
VSKSSYGTIPASVTGKHHTVNFGPKTKKEKWREGHPPYNLPLLLQRHNERMGIG